jgi:hypothetical protein
MNLYGTPHPHSTLWPPPLAGSRLCHCPRRRPRANEPVGKCEVRDTRFVICDGVDHRFASCEFPTLDLQMHFAHAGYGLSPYAGDEWARTGLPPGYLPSCTGSLAHCFEQVWRRQNNSRFGLGCMLDARARQPQLGILNVNMWYWWRLKLRRGGGGGAQGGAHTHDAAVMVNGEWRQRGAFIANLSVMASSLHNLLPDTAVWALHTTALPVYGALVKL